MNSFVISKVGEDNGYGGQHETNLIFKRSEPEEAAEGYIWCIHFNDESEFFLTEKEVCQLEQALAGRNTLEKS